VVLPDQLSLEIGPASRAKPGDTRVVLLESDEWLSRRPYHRQRIGTILLCQRAFALEAKEAGFEVVVLRGREPMVDLLRNDLARSDGSPAAMAMEPAERETRVELAPLVSEGRLRFVPHEGFLANLDDLEAGRTAEGFRMDRFYQRLRRQTGILMKDGAPVGGKFSFDAENRRPWRGEPLPPEPPRFPICALRREVAAEIESRFSEHPGTLDLAAVPARREEVERVWLWVKRSVLPEFGPFEDAMSHRHRGLFHSRLSSIMNLHRILPKRIVEETLALPIPLQSKEGFVRQILGWREFVALVHRATDGLRRVGKAKLTQDALAADLPLPATFWGGAPSGMNCLDTVVADVWREGYSHHITRLMILGNLGTLLGVSPRELTDWFWVAYTDAYDWVVEPNVLAMGTFAAGDLMTTKPYIAGSAYIAKMSDYCDGCALDPKKTCPLPKLYWAWLARHRDALAGNQRLAMPLASLAKRSATQRADDAATFADWRARL